MAWPEAVAAADRGEIADAKSLVGLYRLARKMERPVVPPQPGDRAVVRAQYRITAGDVMRASASLTRASVGNRLFSLVMIGLGIVNLLIDQIAFGTASLLIGVSLLTGVLTVPFAWYQVRKRPELFDQDAEFIADEEGLRYTSPFGSGSSPWNAFKRVREMSGYFFLDSGVGANMILPLRAFDDESLAHLHRILFDAGFSPDGKPVDRADRPRS
jgi:hypothetical protein